jgi:hypothetical protein
MTSLLEAQEGRVYLDTAHPRVCIAGPEERERDDLGYARLADGEVRRPFHHGAVLCRIAASRVPMSSHLAMPLQVFPFYELRAAAADLRLGGGYDGEETARRVGAQRDDTLSSYGHWRPPEQSCAPACWQARSWTRSSRRACGTPCSLPSAAAPS